MHPLYLGGVWLGENPRMNTKKPHGEKKLPMSLKFVDFSR